LRLVLFHRDFRKFQGGHLKVFHYFQHVRSSPGFEARIRFTPESTWDETNPWWSLADTVVRPDEPLPDPDVLFAAGFDWQVLEREGRGGRDGAGPPIVNLIQDFRALHAVSPLQGFFAHHAIRVCVSPELQEAIERSGLANGPIMTVPIGFDQHDLPEPWPDAERDVDGLVLAIKDPPLGRRVAERLRKEGHEVLLIEHPLPRQELLAAMARSRVAVLLPALVEGAYLPALESMALGALVVCPDVVGNRSFCRDGETCFVRRRDARALGNAALDALRASPQEREPMLAAARELSRGRSLEAERDGLRAVLERADTLWAGG
jgi:glycosyltransferase involved in cell wall biosynthesis